MKSKVLTIVMILVLLLPASTVIAAPLVSQTTEMNGSQVEKTDAQGAFAPADSGSGTDQQAVESITVGQISDNALWIALGVGVLIAIAIVAS